MPEKKTLARARKDKREGKAPTTQAGEFVREEMDHVKEGKHPVKNRKQAIAIGLSKARRSGVNIPDRSKKSAAKKKTTTKKKSTTAKKKTTTKKKKTATKKKSK